VGEWRVRGNRRTAEGPAEKDQRNETRKHKNKKKKIDNGKPKKKGMGRAEQIDQYEGTGDKKGG